MPPPPIQVFLTTIASQPALRQRQEYVLRVLQVKKVPFTSYDLASDEEAKKLWRRKAPLGYRTGTRSAERAVCDPDKQQLPGILIGGEFPGVYLPGLAGRLSACDFGADALTTRQSSSEEAVEFGELDTFLRLNEEWEPLEDDKPLLRAVPVGIPGAHSPSQMNPSHVSPSPSPAKPKPREGQIDAGEKLGDAGLQGVNVTEDDLLALVEELGLGEEDANELVKGLGGNTRREPKPKPEKEVGNPTKDKQDEVKNAKSGSTKMEDKLDKASESEKPSSKSTDS
ncbi:hypothetical protein BD414DRAFT_530047 [Trametes punicea]|nr:hypothetical protein BD414DRAFT_530047 [Trametes punicea]